MYGQCMDNVWTMYGQLVWTIYSQYMVGVRSIGMEGEVMYNVISGV